MGSEDQSVSYSTLFRDPRLLTITLVSFTVTFGEYAASPALPSMVSELGVSQANVGLVIAAFVIPGIFMLPLTAILSDLYGRRIVLIPSLLLFGTGGTAIWFVHSFEAILVLRVLQGIGGASIMSLAITLIGDIYSGPTGSAALGIRLSANGLSSIIIPAFAGFLAGIAWNYPFLLYLMAFPAALLTYFYVPETINESKDESFRNKIRTYFSAIRSEFANLNTSILVWGGFFHGFSYFVIITFVPLFAVDSLNASLFMAGAVLSARGLIRIPVSPAAGWLLMYMSRKQALILTLSILAVGTALIGTSTNIMMLFLIIALFGVGDSLFTPTLEFAVADQASTEQRSGLVSVMSILRRIGASLSSALFGLVLVMVGFKWLFTIAGAFYGTYAILIFLFFSPDG